MGDLVEPANLGRRSHLHSRKWGATWEARDNWTSLHPIQSFVSLFPKQDKLAQLESRLGKRS